MGAAIEVIDQKLIQKKESIDWKAVAYEAVVGAVGGAIGGIGQTAVKTAATKTAAKVTAKTVAKAAAKTIALEAAGGFIADVGRQVYVDGKAPEEVDYGQAIKTAAVAGTAGAIGYAGEQVVKKAGSQLATNVTKHVDKAVDSVDNQIVRSVPSNQVSASTAGNHVPVSSTSVNKAASITTNSIDDVVPSRSVGAESAIKRSYQDSVDKAATDNAKARTLAVESGSISRYDRTGYQSSGRNTNLLGRDRSTRKTTNLTEWRRSIGKQDIHNEMRLFLGDDYVKIDSGKWRSLDGTRQFRVKPDDYLGYHGIGQPIVPNTPHVHFEFLTPRSNGNGFDVIKNIHVPISD